MSNARDIIVRPLVTEKTMAQENQNTVVFEVAKGTNKIQIKQAIEEIFNVKVDSVLISETVSEGEKIEEVSVVETLTLEPNTPQSEVSIEENK